MLTLVGVGIFAGTFAASIYAIVSTVAPRFDRIVMALRGQPQIQHQPLAVLVRAERRIAVRRWAGQASRPFAGSATIAPWRAAA